MVETAKTLVKGNRLRATDPDITGLETEIYRRFAGLSDPSTAAIRTVRRQFSKVIANASGQLVHKLALQLLHRAKIPRFFPYELVQHHRAAFQSLNPSKLKRLSHGLSSWGEVDAFACYLSGPAWRNHLVQDRLITTWAHSRDRWHRRAAVVSTVPLNNKARGGHGNVERTLLICRIVVRDRDDMVVKALSWALRELSKRDAKAVKLFLSDHKHELASRVIREVTNKLKTGLKNPRTMLAERGR